VFLRFKDRTWILLGKLVDKGEKEGNIKHIEVPLKEWHMLRREWKDLPSNEQRMYINRFKIVTEDNLPVINPVMIMDEDFVDSWVEGKYTIYYRDAKLVPDCPEWTGDKKEEEKAKAETEKLG
jgi:hypothetical protein